MGEVLCIVCGAVLDSDFTEPRPISDDVAITGLARMRKGLVLTSGLLYLVSALVFWAAGFLSYFRNFAGVARWAGALYLPILALPFVGRGEIAGVAVRSFAWWELFALQMLLAGLGIFLYRGVATSEVGEAPVPETCGGGDHAESRDSASQ